MVIIYGFRWVGFLFGRGFAGNLVEWLVKRAIIIAKGG